MKMIEIYPHKNTDLEEYKKSICFVSPDIVSVQLKNEKIVVGISEQGDVVQIQKDLQEMMKKYKLNGFEGEKYYQSEKKNREYFDLYEDGTIIDFGNGQVGLDSKGKFLLDYFDDLFCETAKSLGAIEKQYPVMIPIGQYAMTGYIRKSPQYAIFCSPIKDFMEMLEKADSAVSRKEVNTIIKEPDYALSPSACFHTYIEYRNKELEHNMLITFRQNVFRNEGRLNYTEKGRLCDYQVREIVMIGSQEYCIAIRDKIMEASVNLMKQLGMVGDITLSSDSFVIPKMQMYRKIQKIDKSKYEMHLFVDENNKISTASYNLHGKAFTDPFQISVRHTDTVTACVGFGLHRFLMAFLCQFGSREEKWPNQVLSAFQAQKK